MIHLSCLTIFGLTGCGADSLCSSEVLQVARDPGGDRYAVTEVRNCGATTDFTTVVRVGRASERQSAATEVFVADSNHQLTTVGEGGAIWINVAWLAPGRLSVVYASDARIFKREASAKGALISYRAGDRISPTPPS